MRVGSLFSGIGGLDLGLERAGMTVAWQSEIDEYASRVLDKHWPNVPNLGDITTIDWSTVEPVDLIAGGYPCPSFSYAGNRQGLDDDRYLWPPMRDAVRILRPRYVLIENVPGHLSLGFDRTLGDLAELGFDAEWTTITACSMGASHRRPRLFCVAYDTRPDEQGQVSRFQIPRDGWPEPRGGRRDESGPGWWLPEPAMDRMADGVPRRLVSGPLRGIGNAVVPQVAEWVGRQIMEAIT